VVTVDQLNYTRNALKQCQMKKVAPKRRQSDKKPPLVGRRILVTRQPSQIGPLVARLEKLGARVVHAPTIETTEPKSWDFTDEAISQLDGYQWVVFTSPNAAKFFLRRVREKRPSAHPLNQAIVCAIGIATANTLSELGCEPSLVASISTAEGLLAHIAEQAGGAHKLRGARFLLPRSNIARPDLPDGLTQLGAIVTAVECYRTERVALDGETLYKLFIDEPVHAVIFTSPSTVENLAAGLQPSLSEVFRDALIACIGPVTARAAEAFGLKRIVVPEVHSMDSLIELVVDKLT